MCADNSYLEWGIHGGMVAHNGLFTIYECGDCFMPQRQWPTPFHLYNSNLCIVANGALSKRGKYLCCKCSNVLKLLHLCNNNHCSVSVVYVFEWVSFVNIVNTNCWQQPIRWGPRPPAAWRRAAGCRNLTWLPHGASGRTGVCLQEYSFLVWMFCLIYSHCNITHFMEWVYKILPF